MTFGECHSQMVFLKKTDFEKEKFYNLDVGFNEKISLFQGSWRSKIFKYGVQKLSVFHK